MTHPKLLVSVGLLKKMVSWLSSKPALHLLRVMVYTPITYYVGPVSVFYLSDRLMLVWLHEAWGV